MEQMRSDFEKAYSNLMGTPVSVIVTMREDERYRYTEGDRLQIAWLIWQASHASIELELPAWFVSDAIAVYDRDEVEETLSAAGLRVKEK